MNSYLRKIINYSAGNIANKVLLLLLLPMFSKFMLPAEYAVYTNIMLFFSFAGLIYILGIQQALFSYFNAQKHDAYRVKLISSVFITIITSGTIFTFLIIIFSRYLSLWIVRDAAYSSLFVWIGITLFFNNITSVSLALLNVMERSGSYVILGFIQNSLFFALLMAGGIIGIMGIEYVFISLLLSTIISSLAGIFIIGRIYKGIPGAKMGVFSADVMLPLLKFGLIMIPGTIAMIILRAADRLMLAYLSAGNVTGAMHNVGIYAMSYKIGAIMQFLITLISTVFLPYAMRIADKDKAPEIYRLMFRYYLWGGGILGFFIILFSPEIFTLLIDPEYIKAAQITFIGVISTYMQGIFNLISVIFYARRRAGNIASAVILGALINIGLNFILIPVYGIYGAGAASIIAYLFIVVFNYSVAEKSYHSGYRIAYLFITLPLLSLSILITNSLPVSFNIALIKIAISLAFLALLLWQLYRNNEIAKVMKIVRKK